MNTLSKILLSTLALCYASMGIQAQKYETGQIINIDGHTAIVVYVDSTGEHGLLAGPSLALYDKKKYSPKKFVEKKFSGDKKKHNALRYFEQGKLGIVLKAQLTEDEEENLRKPAFDSLTSRMGDVNQRYISHYCEQKGLDIAKFFPEYAWAQSLGEGWFIGGIEEVNRYVNTTAKSKQTTQELNQKSIDEGHTYFYPLNLVSSTHIKYVGKMCMLSQCWTYIFRFKKVQEYKYVVAAKKTMPVWVEKKEVQLEHYEEWKLGTNLLGAFLDASRERSYFYDPDYSWKSYLYRLAFKRF